MTDKPAHGGKREGAGRPRKYPEGGEISSFWVSRSNIQWLIDESQRTKESLSHIVNRALQALRG